MCVPAQVFRFEVTTRALSMIINQYEFFKQCFQINMKVTRMCTCVQFLLMTFNNLILISGDDAFLFSSSFMEKKKIRQFMFLVEI